MQDIKLKAAGLYLDSNALAEVPEGAMSQATNVVIRRPGISETRRGFASYAPGLSPGPCRLASYKGSLAAWTASDGLVTWTGGAWQSNTTATISPPDSPGIPRFAQARSNLYITTSDGPRRLDALSNDALLAGVVQALDFDDQACAVTGSSGFLVIGSSVGYRVAFAHQDANGGFIIGAPSGRIIVKNSGATAANVALKAPIPVTSLSGGDYYLVYRTLSFATDDPGDEMQLCFQGQFTSTDFSNGYITLTDITPDALLGATAYFSPSQEGILAGNTPPPICRDMALHKTTMLFADCTVVSPAIVSILAVGASSGVQTGDVVTVGTTAFTGASSANYATHQFQVVTSGTAAQNIEATARSLVSAINYAGSGLRAQYLSSPDDAPGKVAIYGGAVIASAHGSAYAPPLPSSGTTVNGSSVRYKNRLYMAKAQQHESVPLLNFLEVGSADAALLRAIPLRDSTILLKEDGVWRLTGEDANSIRVDPLDPTAVCVAPDSAAAVGNRVICWANQGAVSITDTGVSVLSFGRIDSILRSTLAAAPTASKVYSFATGYESERDYILFIPAADTDTSCSVAYVYNLFTDAWVRWDKANTEAAIVHSDGKLYLDGSDGTVRQERKSFTSADYQDESGAAITTTRQWLPAHGGAPFAGKQFTEAEVYTEGVLPTALTLSFASELSPTFSDVALSPGAPVAPNPGETWTLVPLEQQRCSRLSVKVTHSTAQENLALLGLTLRYRAYGEKRPGR